MRDRWFEVKTNYGALVVIQAPSAEAACYRLLVDDRLCWIAKAREVDVAFKRNEKDELRPVVVYELNGWCREFHLTDLAKLLIYA